ncbi:MULTISPECIES: HD-GYP domain-containing protein [Paenibacillus]|uniref:HD-GYP domain-containing protein n=1 Tax=Paenibacillus TaxID=44249 RepID=UPI0022B913AB|nr:HD-GYP domain-containing protein [Paenibacillus caseinilyticus]MCZ8519191.1 HD-GYP domain-containing protein [Paenibacillus caseinilyticus]
MGQNTSYVLTPCRRFTITLGFSVCLIGVMLSAVTLWGCSSFVTRYTVELTRAAIVKHFAKLPQLAAIFPEAPAGATAGSTELEPTGAEGLRKLETSADLLQSYDRMLPLVRMHFDLYSILDANFYDPSGRIVFSYNKEAIGLEVEAAMRSSLEKAATNAQVVQERLAGHILHLWMPIQREDGQVAGIIEVKRDISEQNRQIGWLEGILMTIIVLGMLGLFLALHHVYRNSAGMIDRKNRELRDMVSRIERTYDESLQALSSALDSRDNETHGHSFRVTSYALRLGMELGLTDKELGYLARGALLHDVGKIGVPDAILLKPAELTEEEWVVMKSHVEIGYRMLKHIAFLSPSLDVVRYHHERWDGGGYPYGLREIEIPLYARIFALCDSYDAMTSDRPYRKGWGYAEARAEIERCCGTQFCPEVVAAFLRIPQGRWLEVEELSRKGEPRVLLGRVLEETMGLRTP